MLGEGRGRCRAQRGWEPARESERGDTGPQEGSRSPGPARLRSGLASARAPARVRVSAAGPPTPALSLQKEGPSAAPVFTVDYGELDFQWREKTPEPPAPCAPEQTEYATIVFPSRPGSPGPLPLRPEDGPCPWPL